MKKSLITTSAAGIIIIITLSYVLFEIFEKKIQKTTEQTMEQVLRIPSISENETKQTIKKDSTTQVPTPTTEEMIETTKDIIKIGVNKIGNGFPMNWAGYGPDGPCWLLGGDKNNNNITRNFVKKYLIKNLTKIYDDNIESLMERLENNTILADRYRARLDELTKILNVYIKNHHKVNNFLLIEQKENRYSKYDEKIAKKFNKLSFGDIKINNSDYILYVNLDVMFFYRRYSEGGIEYLKKWNYVLKDFKNRLRHTKR